MENCVWKDRKRTVFGLPWSFTRYSLTPEKLTIDTGLFTRKEEDVRLYRVIDVTMKRTLGQRICGVGTIHLCTADKSAPEINIVSIKKPRQFKDMLSDMVEAQREAKKISIREYISSDANDECPEEEK